MGNQGKFFVLAGVLLPLCLFLSLPMAGGERVATPMVTDTVPQQAPDSATLHYNNQRQFDYFFLEAVRQQEAGHYDAAFDLLSHCLKLNPKAAEAYFLLSQYLSELHQDSLALSYLERAAALRPSNGTYQERVAQQYIGMGDYAKATDTYERFWKANRSRSDVLALLVQLYRQQKNYGMMLDALGRLEQAEGEDEQLALAKMNVYELMGDSKNAYKVLKGLADGHPNDLNYSVMLGNWLIQHKRQKEAYKLFAAALKEEPDNVYAQSSMYDYYRQSGQEQLAQEVMERILLGRNTPSATRMQFFRQAIQENEQEGGDSTKIIHLIARMQQVTPRDTLLAQLKVAYYGLKHLPSDSINRALVELLDVSPDNAGARLQLLQNKWGSQDWKALSEIAEPGMLYNPDEMAFYYFTGLTRFYEEDDQGALAALRKGTEVKTAQTDPNMVADLFGVMGEIYHKMGDDKSAYEAYDSCLQYKPDDAMVLNNYAYFLCLDGKDLKRAEEMSARAVKADAKSATFLDTYAWILFRQGRYAEAKIYIDLAIKSDTDSVTSADVLDHAGEIYAKNNDFTAAVHYWEWAIQSGGDKDALTRKIKLYATRKK